MPVINSEYILIAGGALMFAGFGTALIRTAAGMKKQAREKEGLGSHIGFEPTVFGRRAFWFHTPMSSLDEGEKALRTLMRSLQAYVRHQGWLKRLRSLDSAHERWELERSTKGREERTEDIRKTDAQGAAPERKEV